MPFVAAESMGEGIGRVFKNLFGFLLVDFDIGDPIKQFYVKFLIWVLVFTVLYYSSLRIFGENTPRGVIITIPLTLSLISVLLIKDEMVQTIAESYGFFVAFILLGAPIVGIIFIMRAFKEESLGRAAFAIKAALFYLMAVIIHNMIGITKEFNLDYMNLDQWVQFVADLVLILFLWYLGRTLFYGGGQNAAGGAPGGFGNWWQNFFTPAQPEQVTPNTPNQPGQNQPPGQPAPPQRNPQIINNYVTPLRTIHAEMNTQLNHMSQAHINNVVESRRFLNNNNQAIPTGWSQDIHSHRPVPPANVRNHYVIPRNNFVVLIRQFVNLSEALVNRPDFASIHNDDLSDWTNVSHDIINMIEMFIGERNRFEPAIPGQGDIDYD